MFLQLFAFSWVLQVSIAHFTTTWPPARGFDDDKAATFPCGGFDTPSSNRTDFPISGSPIQIDLHHTQTRVAVYLAIGSIPGDNYNVVLRPQFQEQGPGNMCIGAIEVLDNLNISDQGLPATIQVVSNGDPNGGLYQCSDVLLMPGSLSQDDYGSHCTNATGVQITQQNMSGSPNGTSSSSSSGTGSSSGSAASPSHTGQASRSQAISWAMGVVAVAGLAIS